MNRRQTAALLGASLGVVFVVMWAVVRSGNGESATSRLAIGDAALQPSPLVNGEDLDPNLLHRLGRELAQLQSPIRQMSHRFHDYDSHPSFILNQQQGHLAHRRSTMKFHRLHSEVRDRSVFVALISRSTDEQLCAESVRGVFDSAEEPFTVNIGLIHENNQPSNCIRRLSDMCGNPSTSPHCPLDNVRYRLLKTGSLQGYAYGRFLAMQLHKGERFVLFTDSDVQLRKHWNSMLIRQWHETATLTKSFKLVLSQLPMEESKIGQSDSNTSAVCRVRFASTAALPKLYSKSFEAKGQRGRISTPFVSTRFLFGSAHALIATVPPDEELRGLPEGDSLLMSARLWTHGYDAYAPGDAIAFRRASDEGEVDAPLVTGTDEPREESRTKVLQVLLVPKVTPKHYSPRHGGLGNKRPLARFLHLAGLDLNRKVDTRGSDGGGRCHWAT